MLLSALIITILAGIANAWYLYWQWRQYKLIARPMLCPLDGKCEEVVGTVYGTTLGVKNELWGLLYYFSLLGMIGIYLLYAPLAPTARLLILVSSGFSVLFSSYLLFIQLFLLRKYCSWCILAAFINYLIFVFEIIYFF